MLHSHIMNSLKSPERSAGTARSTTRNAATIISDTIGSSESKGGPCQEVIRRAKAN